MAGGLILHARQGPAGGDTSLAPGIGGSQVAQSTAPVDNSGLLLDPTVTKVLNPTTAYITTTTTQTSQTQSLLDSLTVSSTTPTPTQATSSSSAGGHRTTIIIAAVAGAALALIALCSLLLFCRSGTKKEQRKRRASSDNGEQHNWRELESQHSHPEYKGMGAAAAMAEYKGGRPTAHSRQSSVAAPSLNLQFEPEPLMSRNPFDSPNPNAPPVPQLPHTPQLREPPPSATSPAISRAPSEFSAPYYRSMYSDSQSVHSSRRSFTLKRSPSSKSRNNNQKELIALDKLISALDLSANDEKERLRQLEPGNHNAQRDSYIPKDFALPPPAVFRAAFGTDDD